MNDNIKTGKEIRKELLHNSQGFDRDLVIQLENKKWVSLDWLKEQIEKRKDLHTKFHNVGCACSDCYAKALKLAENNEFMTLLEGYYDTKM